MDASSVPIGRAESDLSAPSTSDTDQWNGDDPPAVVLDGVRSPFPLVVLKHVFMFKSKSLINPKTFCVFWCIQDQRGTVGLKCLFTVGGVKVRWCALRCVPDVGYWLWWIFVELIIVFLRRATNHDSVNIYIFSPGRSFYRLRLVRNLNGTGFIICSGKVVSVYL